MSYSLNGPENRDEVEYHDCAVVLGLASGVAVRELVSIADSGGRLSDDSHQLEEFAKSLKGDVLGEHNSLFRDSRFRDFPSLDMLYDVLDETGYTPERVLAMTEKLYDPSVSDFQRLVAANNGLCFFRALRDKCDVRSEYPKIGLPERVREMARLMVG